MTCYNTNHAKRGTALIFNHKYFDPKLGLRDRNGTNMDRDRLANILREEYRFKVHSYNDLSYKQIEKGEIFQQHLMIKVNTYNRYTLQWSRGWARRITTTKIASWWQSWPMVTGTGCLQRTGNISWIGSGLTLTLMHAHHWLANPNSS